MSARRDARAPEGEPDAHTEERPRWHQRALPVTGLVVVGLAAAALTLPDDEIELSTSRRPQPFVELYLTGSGDQVCDAERLRFRMQSHLVRQRTVTYQVAVAAAGQPPTTREQGSLRLDPQEAKSVWTEVTAPSASAYTVTVELLGRPELLRVHCGSSS